MSNYQRVDDKTFVRKNEQIRCARVLLVKDGQKLGVYPSFEALRIAREEGLDLVEVAPNAQPPVCSIMDYGKYKFDQQIKEKERKKHLGPKEKEITFRYVIGDNDLKIKVDQAKRFIEDGDKVRFSVKFKARENAHKDQGMMVINKCLDMIRDIVNIDKLPALEGNQIICRVSPKTEKGK